MSKHYRQEAVTTRPEDNGCMPKLVRKPLPALLKIDVSAEFDLPTGGTPTVLSIKIPEHNRTVYHVVNGPVTFSCETEDDANNCLDLLGV